jgi:hypothetical protein
LQVTSETGLESKESDRVSPPHSGFLSAFLPGAQTIIGAIEHGLGVTFHADLPEMGAHFRRARSDTYKMR